MTKWRDMGRVFDRYHLINFGSGQHFAMAKPLCSWYDEIRFLLHKTICSCVKLVRNEMSQFIINLYLKKCYVILIQFIHGVSFLSRKTSIFFQFSWLNLFQISIDKFFDFFSNIGFIICFKTFIKNCQCPKSLILLLPIYQSVFLATLLMKTTVITCYLEMSGFKI